MNVFAFIYERCFIIVSFVKWTNISIKFTADDEDCFVYPLYFTFNILQQLRKINGSQWVIESIYWNIPLAVIINIHLFIISSHSTDPYYQLLGVCIFFLAKICIILVCFGRLSCVCSVRFRRNIKYFAQSVRAQRWRGIQIIHRHTFVLLHSGTWQC